MSWTYNDWEDADTYTTVAARLSRLRLHMGEVRAAIQAGVSADGKSRSSGDLVTYLAQLREDRKELEQSPGAMTGGGMFKIRRGELGPGSGTDQDAD